MSDWSDEENYPAPKPVQNEEVRQMGRGRGRGKVDQSRDFPRVPKPSMAPNWRNKNVDMYRNTSESRQTDCVPVPKRMIGRIIGKGGAKIKEIRQTSGARVDIQEQGLDSTVVLSGTPEQIERARSLVNEIIDDDVIRPPRDSSPLHNDPNIPSHWGTIEDTEEDEFGPKEEEASTFIDWNDIRANLEANEEKRWAHLPKINKDFYVEQDCVKNRSKQEVDFFRDWNNCIQVKNFNPEDKSAILNPTTTFEEAFLDYPEILETIHAQGFERPSPIQSQMWPYLMSGKDVIGIAQTGTGKTLSFLLPAFIHIEGQPTPRGQRGGPNVLIFAPTRELAQQIAMEVKKYEYRGIKSVCVYGGGNIKEQLKQIKDGVEIIIATPGRFNHFVETGDINLNSITYLVLDEADRMLDQGFEFEIRKTLIDIRPDRTTVMTSATWPEDVRRMATKYMSDPATVFVGSLDLAAVHSVSQEIVQIDEADKKDYLIEFIQKMEPDDKVIVFGGRKTTVSDLSVELCFKGISCQSIHGDRDQEDRESALKDLKTGEVRILLATDVASRGLDIEDVSHVINYDFPRDMEEYVHRIGRTGRAGKTGKSISLFTREDWRKAPELIDVLEEADQPVPDWLRGEANRFLAFKERRAREKAEFGGAGGGGRSGGGARSGGGGGCFKCGESGHFARECPQSGGSGGRGGGGGGRGDRRQRR